MPQLHLYVSDEEAALIRRRAEMQGMSVSRWLARVVKREVGPGWPAGWFEQVLGGWRGPPLRRDDVGDWELRPALDPPRR